MDQDIKVEIIEDGIAIDKACDFVCTPAHGAMDVFIGTVRNQHDGKSVTGLTYDLHDGLTCRVLQDICFEAQVLWPQTRYYVAHHKGMLAVGGISVVIAVSAPHRAESFDACRYVIETIKKRAPIWKQEHYRDGKSAWLPGHSLRRAQEEHGR